MRLCYIFTAMDIKTGQMINPHNPEFITKKPWYLGGDNQGPTLDHQAAGEVEQTLSMTTADNVAKAEREKVSTMYSTRAASSFPLTR